MRIRHLKSVVTHVLVIDDGEDLVEDIREPVVVSPADWPTYYERFAAELAALQELDD